MVTALLKRLQTIEQGCPSYGKDFLRLPDMALYVHGVVGQRNVSLFRETSSFHGQTDVVLTFRDFSSMSITVCYQILDANTM